MAMNIKKSELFRSKSKSNKDLGEAIKAFGIKISAIKVEAHILACSALQHCADHDDSSYLLKFYTAAGNVARQEAFKAWVGKCSPFRWNKNKNVFSKSKKAEKAGQIFDMKQAMKESYFDSLTETQPEPFTFERLMAVMKSAVNRYNKVENSKTGTIAMTDAQRLLAQTIISDLENRLESYEDEAAALLTTGGVAPKIEQAEDDDEEDETISAPETVEKTVEEGEQVA